MAPFLPVLIPMAFAVLMEWLSLFIWKSLAISFILYSLLACIALPIADLGLRRRLPAKDLLAFVGLKAFSRRDAFIGLGVGAIFALAIWIAFLIGGKAFLEGSVAKEVVRVWGIPAGGLAALYVAALVLNGGIEEFFWRGYLHGTLAGAKPRWLAVGLPALVFGSQHIFVMSALVTNPFSLALMMAGIIGAGCFWGILRERLGGLWAPLLSHLLVSAAYMGILYAFVLR